MLHWEPHYIFPKDLSHAHRNGYSILRAETKKGRFSIGGANYEVSPNPFGDEYDIARFNNEEEVLDAIK